MRKQEIAVVTDSVSNIPKNLIEKYKINVLPVFLRYNDKFFRNGIDITNEEVYEKIKKGEIPGASQVPLGIFLDAYKKLLKNFKSILSIHLTSRLSGTYNSAVSAASRFSPSKITVFDTESVLMAEGFQVLEAARAAYAGEKIENILKRLNYLRNKIEEYIAIDTFKYLQKIGKGRIPNLQLLIAIELNIKPILTLKNGKIVLVKLTRSRNKALHEIVNKIFSDFGEKIKLRIAIMHVLAKEEAIRIKDIFLEKFNCVEMIIVDANPIIGAVGGPGLIGVVACPVEIPSEVLK